MELSAEACFKRTPAAKNRLHFDNCGSSLMTEETIKAIESQLALEFSVGGYVAEERASEQLTDIYGTLAAIFGGSADDYAITTSAVDAWTKGFYSIPLSKGDVILTSYNEYCSNAAAYIHRKERDGVDIRVVPSKPDGSFDLTAFKNAVDARVKLISLSHMPCSSGQITPVVEIGQIAKEIGALYCVDACQTAGQIPLNVDEIGCHILSATSRKFLRGPRGCGFLYLSPGFRDQMSPLIRTNNSGVWSAADEFTWQTPARQFETWEKSTVLRMGFLAALKQYQALGPKKVAGLLLDRAKRLREKLAALDFVTQACPPDAIGAIIGFTVDGIPSEQVKALLEERNIAVQLADIVHTRYDFEARNLGMLVRASPHIYTRDDDIDSFCAALAGLRG